MRHNGSNPQGRNDQQAIERVSMVSRTSFVALLHSICSNAARINSSAKIIVTNSCPNSLLQVCCFTIAHHLHLHHPILFSSFFNQPPAFFSIFSALWSNLLSYLVFWTGRWLLCPCASPSVGRYTWLWMSPGPPAGGLATGAPAGWY
jgi:hypothetical protein